MTTETNEKSLNIKEQNVTDIKFTALVAPDNLTHTRSNTIHTAINLKIKQKADRTHAKGESYIIMYVNLPYLQLDTKRLHTIRCYYRIPEMKI